MGKKGCDLGEEEFLPCLNLQIISRFLLCISNRGLDDKLLILMLDGEKFLNVVFQDSFGAMPAKPKRLLHNMSRQQNIVVSASAYARVG